MARWPPRARDTSRALSAAMIQTGRRSKASLPDTRRGIDRLFAAYRPCQKDPRPRSSPDDHRAQGRVIDAIAGSRARCARGSRRERALIEGSPPFEKSWPRVRPAGKSDPERRAELDPRARGRAAGADISSKRAPFERNPSDHLSAAGALPRGARCRELSYKKRANPSATVRCAEHYSLLQRVGPRPPGWARSGIDVRSGCARRFGDPQSRDEKGLARADGCTASCRARSACARGVLVAGRRAQSDPVRGPVDEQGRRLVERISSRTDDGAISPPRRPEPEPAARPSRQSKLGKTDPRTKRAATAARSGGVLARANFTLGPADEAKALTPYGRRQRVDRENATKASLYKLAGPRFMLRRMASFGRPRACARRLSDQPRARA